MAHCYSLTVLIIIKTSILKKKNTIQTLSKTIKT